MGTAQRFPLGKIVFKHCQFSLIVNCIFTVAESKFRKLSKSLSKSAVSILQRPKV